MKIKLIIFIALATPCIPLSLFVNKAIAVPVVQLGDHLEVIGTYKTGTKTVSSLCSAWGYEISDFQYVTITKAETLWEKVGEFSPTEGKIRIWPYLWGEWVIGKVVFNNTPLYFGKYYDSIKLELLLEGPVSGSYPGGFTLSVTKEGLISNVSPAEEVPTVIEIAEGGWSLITIPFRFIFRGIFDPSMVVVIEDMGISNPMIGSFSPSGAYFYDIAEGTNYFDIGSFSVSDTAEIGWSATQNFKISFLNPDSPTDYSSLTGSFDVRVVPGPVVPVPSALLLLGSGLAGVIGLRRKRLLK